MGLGLTGDPLRSHMARAPESSPRDSELGTCLANPTPHWLKVSQNVNALHLAERMRNGKSPQSGNKVGPGTSGGGAGNRASAALGEPRCSGDEASAASPAAFYLEGISHPELDPHVTGRAGGAIQGWPPGMTPTQTELTHQGTFAL